jgi:DNA-binding NarL/FixJ family response regulator|tara:strand:- start:4379 stop:4816 length:438 start_codon:yes stop_codon:yes gene_type:complete
VKTIKTRVLLAGDNKKVRQTIKKLLDSQDGIEVIGEAEDGEQAIEKVREQGPDVIVMGLTMLNIDGVEATRIIKITNPKVKILILAEHANEKSIYRVFQYGASGYLLKKSIALDLVSAIKEVEKGNTFLSPTITKIIVKRVYKTC